MNVQDFEATPHAFWQEIAPADFFQTQPENGYRNFYPAQLPDGRQLALPIRELADGKTALSSLIINQASFEVVETLADYLAAKLRAFDPEIVVGLPTLGLTLAASVARKLGHTRYVPFSTSRKFWYDEALSVPLRSVTSPDQEKRLYIDPRMLPLLKDRRIVLVDDVISSGTSILAGIRLLQKAGFSPTAIGAAMLQTRRWAEMLKHEAPELCDQVRGAFETPFLQRNDDGCWVAMTPRMKNPPD